MTRHRCSSLRPRSPGFTLIELMIVIAIIAILLSLAIPAYQDYVIRTKVTESLSIAASAKLAVAETCQSDPTVNPTNISTGYAFSPSEFVQAIQISHTCDEPWIVIRTQNTGAQPDVVISLDGYLEAGSNRMLWNCHKVTGDTRYIPISCRGGHLNHNHDP